MPLLSPPLTKQRSSSFLELSFSNRGVASSEFYDVTPVEATPTQQLSERRLEEDPTTTQQELDTSNRTSGTEFSENSFGKREFEWHSARSKLGKTQLGVLQCLGIINMFLLCLAAVAPPYFLVTELLNQCSSAEGSEGCSNRPNNWLPLPLVFPLFMLSFSVLVIICKWLIIGKYQPRQISLLSRDYLRWWFIDRLMHLWEFLVGRLVLETKYAWLFYWLLGADIAWSAKIDAFLRESDLVSVGPNVTVGHPIRCRKFVPWKTQEESPKMVFRPIILKPDCQVSGMVSPGAVIGTGSKVERLAVVKGGAKLPATVIARGSPAYNAGFIKPLESNPWEETILDAFKIVWTLLETYHFSGLFSLAHVILDATILRGAWRYGTLLQWFLAFPLAALLGLLTSVALKWLLIGRRDPSDKYDGSFYHRATNWACDFHFRITALTYVPFFGLSKLGTVFQKLHGLDVDMSSTLNTPFSIFCPSKVDYVKVRSSFLTATHIELDEPSESKIEIRGSSLGYNTHVHAGTKLIRSAVAPRTRVSDAVSDLNPPGISTTASCGAVIRSFLLPEMAQLFLLLVVFGSMIPSYEIARAAALATNNNVQPTTSALGIAAAVVLQLLVWIVLARIIEGALLRLSNLLQLALFGPYINYVWIFRVGNCLEFLLYGTPMFAYYAKLMGARVNGELWYFGSELYEYSKLHFKGHTIVDNAHLSGHYIDGSGLVIDDTVVSGLVHPGCYASAGSRVLGEEHGPWKVFHRIADNTSLPSTSTHLEPDNAFGHSAAKSGTEIEV